MLNVDSSPSPSLWSWTLSRGGASQGLLVAFEDCDLRLLRRLLLGCGHQDRDSILSQLMRTLWAIPLSLRCGKSEILKGISPMAWSLGLILPLGGVVVRYRSGLYLLGRDYLKGRRHLIRCGWLLVQLSFSFSIGNWFGNYKWDNLRYWCIGHRLCVIICEDDCRRIIVCD